MRVGREGGCHKEEGKIYTLQNPGRECEFASGVETHTAGTPHNKEGRRQKKMTSEGHIGAREHEETLIASDCQ